MFSFIIFNKIFFTCSKSGIIAIYSIEILFTNLHYTTTVDYYCIFTFLSHLVYNITIIHLVVCIDFESFLSADFFNQLTLHLIFFLIVNDHMLLKKQLGLILVLLLYC